VVHFHTLHNSHFERIGNDLYTNVTIELWKALYGFSIQIPHLDGHIVNYKRSAIANPFEVVEIEVEGMPQHKTHQKGSLFVKFFIEFPEVITIKQELEIKKLLASEIIIQKEYENDEEEEW